MKIFTLILLVLALGFGTPVLVRADEVTDAVGAAERAYTAGNLAEAEAQLDAALEAVRGRLTLRLADFLPAVPAGWSAAETRGAGAPTPDVAARGDLVVSREYRPPSGASVEVCIAVDSPVAGSLRMFVRNPALASMGGQTGMRKAAACGHDAIETLDDRGVREVSILAGERALVTVTGGDGSDAADIRALVDALDCPGIAALLE